jgi:hypothetical protein
MKQQPQPEEIIVTKAIERLNLSREGVIWNIKHGHLTAHKSNTPLPYWLIAIDDKFLALEKKRSQSHD